MNCREFEKWLDEGRPADGGGETWRTPGGEGSSLGAHGAPGSSHAATAAPAQAHAKRCARCAARLAAALEIEALLEPAGGVAPARFTDAVMSQIHSEAADVAHAGAARSPARSAGPWPGAHRPTAAMPWWVRAAADPACAGAAALAGILIWRGQSAVSGGMAVLESAAGWIAAANVPAGAASMSPAAFLGIAAAAATCLTLISWPLYSWAVRGASAAAWPLRAGRS